MAKSVPTTEITGPAGKIIVNKSEAEKYHNRGYKNVDGTPLMPTDVTGGEGAEQSTEPSGGSSQGTAENGDSAGGENDAASGDAGTEGSTPVVNPAG